MLKQTNPSRRFKDKNGESYPPWETKKLGDIAFRNALKNKDNNISAVLTNSAVDGIIIQHNYFDKDIANKNNLSIYYIVNKDDFVYNSRISKFAPVGPLNKNNLNIKGIVSPLYIVFKLHNNLVNLNFMEIYFKTNIWHTYIKDVANYGIRSDRINITNNDFFNMPIILPCIQEQEKIGNFLKAIDDKIAIQNNKLQALKKYKSGLMQQLFPSPNQTNPLIRFKDKNGDNYPPWETKKLGDVGEITGTGVDKKNNTNDINVILLNYMDVYNNVFININTLSYYTTASNLELNKFNIKKGDIFFTPSSETPNDIAKSSVAIEDFSNAVYSYHLYRLRPDVNFFNLYFSSYIFKSFYFYYQAEKLAQGSGQRYVINLVEFHNIQISIPTLQEQEKIGNFLKAIDDKIAIQNNKLQALKKYKSGLMQQLFPSI